MDVETSGRKQIKEFGTEDLSVCECDQSIGAKFLYLGTGLGPEAFELENRKPLLKGGGLHRTGNQRLGAPYAFVAGSQNPDHLET